MISNFVMFLNNTDCELRLVIFHRVTREIRDTTTTLRTHIYIYIFFFCTYTLYIEKNVYSLETQENKLSSS